MNHLIASFESDIVLMDYKVRGFTRDMQGKKHYIDHRIHSIQQYIKKSTLEQYNCVDLNIYQENLFHTKMLLKDFELENYLFGTAMQDFSAAEKGRVLELLRREMTEIFYSKNIFG